MDYQKAINANLRRAAHWRQREQYWLDRLAAQPAISRRQAGAWRAQAVIARQQHTAALARIESLRERQRQADERRNVG